MKGGGDIEEEDIFYFSFNDGSLDSRSHCDAFHWVNAPFDFFAKEVFDKFLYDGHAGRAADHDDFVDVLNRKIDAFFFKGLLGVFKCLFQGALAALDDRADQIFKFRSVNGLGQMLGAAGICSDEG